jgi:hypothetical protein
LFSIELEKPSAPVWQVKLCAAPTTERLERWVRINPFASPPALKPLAGCDPEVRAARKTFKLSTCNFQPIEEGL